MHHDPIHSQSRARPVTAESSPRGRYGGCVLFALILISTLLGDTTWAQAPKTKTPREDLAIDPESIMQPWRGDLDGMIERRMIRVLVVPSKTFYFNDKGTQRGITYESFLLAEKKLNAQLARSKKLPKKKNLKVHFYFIPVGRDEIFSALTTGKGDIAAANLSLTPQRTAIVDFATAHIKDVNEVVLTGPASPTVSTLGDLAGKEIIVRKSSAYYENLVALNQRFVAERKPSIVLDEAPDDLEDEDLIEMLNAGLVPLLVVDKHIADFWKKVFKKVVVHDSIAVHSGGQIGWAIRKNSPQLKAFLDGVVVDMTSGHLVDDRATILARYLKNTSHVRNAGADAERAKFLSVVNLFHKYGDRYDVDWLLMAAQGYQESRLNQTARSPSGAIGVMQLMPATGKEMRVGDITKLEPNINAGVKYMRFMIDQYFEKEPMTRLDKALFAFASYNAGAARIARLRKDAERRGLDPNVWFHNVEVIAGEQIGPETVTYVSNIYKYYIAYELIEKSIEEREKAKQDMKNAPPR